MSSASDRDESELTERERRHLDTHFDIQPEVRKRWAQEDKHGSRRKPETQRDRDRETAAQGENPVTGKFWPFWKPWPTAAERRAAQERWDRTKFTTETGRAAGQRTSEAKRSSCRRNGMYSGVFGVLGKIFGARGGRPRRATA